MVVEGEAHDLGTGAERHRPQAPPAKVRHRWRSYLGGVDEQKGAGGGSDSVLSCCGTVVHLGPEQGGVRP